MVVIEALDMCTELFVRFESDDDLTVVLEIKFYLKNVYSSINTNEELFHTYSFSFSTLVSKPFSFIFISN